MTRYRSASPSSSRSLFGYCIALVVLGAIGFGVYTLLSDLEGPTITLQPDTGRIAPTQNITLILTDAASDIRSVSVVVRKGGNAVTVFERAFTSGARTQRVTFTLKEAGLKDGPFDLEIKARDTALAGFGQGNATTRIWPMRIDTQPPRISVRSSTPSLRRGSITAVAFALSEEAARAGVQVGDVFFPAYKQPNGLYYCFIAFPLNMAAAHYTPEIVATDLAGNEAKSRLLVHAQDRTYRADTMNIGDKFLNSKYEILQQMVPECTSPLDCYVRVNQETRLKDEAMLRELASQSAPTMLWNGAFQRLPGSAVMAQFGDNRTYKYNNEIIDRQTHMGLDLASLAKAPVPAANSGKVLFAGLQGIFGNLVVIDHGLGLMSLYSHMSSIDVKVGDQVKKGDIIAHTGTTGLAGGDHLHFGILLNGIQCQPIDWLDKNWLKNTITDRLLAAGKD